MMTLLLIRILLLQVVDVLSFNLNHHHCHHQHHQQQQQVLILRPPISFRRRQRSNSSRRNWWNPLLTLRSSSSSSNNLDDHQSSNEAITASTTTTTTTPATTTVDNNSRTTEEDIYKIVEETLQLSINKMVDHVMTPEFFLENDSNLKQLYTKSIKLVEVQPSTIPNAGLGLFATKNIKAGTIISMYPAHTLGVELPPLFDDHGSASASGSGSGSSDSKEIWVTASNKDDDRLYFANNPPSSASPYLHATDQPIFGRPSLLATKFPQFKDLPIYLDVNPNNNNNHDDEQQQQLNNESTIWVSQYINDGAVVQTNDQLGIEAYYAESSRRKNCIHIPFGPSPVIATVTTKKNKKGEELFTSYGCVYWLGSFEATTTTATATATSATPGMNTQIQSQIRQSAQDLFSSMKTVQTLYRNQIESFQQAYFRL